MCMSALRAKKGVEKDRVNFVPKTPALSNTTFVERKQKPISEEKDVNLRTF